MLTIYDGRGELWQWDIERKLVVTDETATEVHFGKSDNETALVCEVYSEGEARVVNIPNIMLQDYANLIAYTYDTTHTKRCTVFAINRRAKPADYVYTETEVKSYEALDARVRVLEEGGTGEPGEDGESAYEIAVRLGFDGSEAEWLESLKGADGENGRPAMHSWDGTVLTVTSASGTSSADLKGADGKDGKDGKDGESGVYVGTETPNDNANVWINPEGEASTEGVYELIDTMTLNEESAKVVLDREPDGTLYNFKSIMIRATFPPCDYSGNISVNYWVGDWTKGVTGYFLSPYNANTTRYGFTKVHIEHGRYMSGWWTCVNGPGEHASYYENPCGQGKYTPKDGILNHVEILHTTGIPAGTVFEIWGVRVHNA